MIHYFTPVLFLHLVPTIWPSSWPCMHYYCRWFHHIVFFTPHTHPFNGPFSRTTRVSRDVHETFSAETETRPRRWELCPRRDWDETLQVAEMLPRRLVKSGKHSPQVAVYRDNWCGITASHVAFIIWAFYGLVNAVVVCDTGFCRVLVCCWCRTAAAGSDLDWLLFNSLSLAQCQLIFYLIVTWNKTGK